MARELSTAIQTVLASDTHNVFLCYDLTLSDGITTVRGAEVELELSSINLNGTSVSIAPVLYSAKILEDPDIKYYRQATPSGGQLVLHDLAHDLGVLVSQLENVLEGAQIVVSKCFLKPDGTCEADPYFIGIVRDVKAQDESIALTLIRDVDSRTAIVAERSLTQRCLADYGDARCGRPAGLIAPGETCSNIFDDAVNGCLAKRWQFRYWGIPILRLITRTTGYNGWGPGDGDDPWHCPSPDAYVAISQTYNKIVPVKVSDLVEGMIVRDSLGRFAVIDALQYAEEPMSEVTASNGARLECSETHPIIQSIGDLHGTAAVNAPSMSIGSDFRGGQRKFFNESVKIRSIGTGKVRHIHLSNSSTSLYDAGMDPELMITGHNNKLPPDYYPQMY